METKEGSWVDPFVAGLRFLPVPVIHPHPVGNQKSAVEAEVVPKVSPAINIHPPRVLRERQSRSTDAIWGLSAQVLPVPGLLNMASPNPQVILT